MEQRDDSWHEARRETINASEAGGLMGFNPYTSAKAARKQWVKKYHGERRDFDNADMARGRRLEPFALDYWESGHGLVMQDAGRIFDEWLRASGDGWYEVDGGEEGVEVKAPRKFFDIRERQDYLLQMYLQCVCYNWDACTMLQVVEYDDGGDLVYRDDRFTCGELLAMFPTAVLELKQLRLDMIDEDYNPDPVQIPEGLDPDLWAAAEGDYAIAKAAATEAKKVSDEMRDGLLALADGKPVRGQKFQTVESTRTGVIAWKKLQADYPDIDLDEYRAEPTTSISVREVK